MMIKATFLLFILLYNTSFLFAQNTDSERRIHAYKLQEGEHVTLDGRIHEDFWMKIEPATDFRMQEPAEGAPASEKTEVRIAFDNDNLYLGVILYDSDPSQIKAFLKRRDVRITSDERFTWIFDTFNDQRSAYFLEINPNGLRTDGLITVGQGSSINLNWDGIWDARTVIGDFGWSAEIIIPFRSLNFDPNSDTWGANFMRVIRRKNETVLWSGHRRNQGIERPQNAGILTGLTGMSQGLGIEVIPYGIINRNYNNRVVPSETEITPDAGVDINYSITPGLKASLTFNTDFAEAEVDQRQVNLTRFPLQFPEQRNFFLEGSNIYDFAPTSQAFPFFSRNIGLSDGQQVPITYGARLLGNAGNYNLAFLQVRTGEKGSTNPENFTVARVKRNLGRESTFGIIYTRRATEDSENLSPTLQDRHTFGTDLELGTSTFLGDKNLQFQAFFIAHSPGFSDDNTTNTWNRSMRGIRLNFPNQPWSGHVSYREVGENYDPAVGFNQRNSFRRVNPRIGFSPQFENSNLIQQMEWDVWFEHLTDMDFTTLTQGWRFTLLNIGFVTGDQFGIQATQSYELLLEPFDIRRDGSIIIPTDSYSNWMIGAELETAPYRKISAGVDVETGSFWTGTQTQYGIELTLRPFPGIELLPQYIHTKVDLDEGSFTADLVRFRSNVDFTTSLFLSSTVQYDNLSKLLGLNSRLRWIVTPGSDLFLVYNHNWTDQNSRFTTLETSGTVKLSYTHRF